MKVCRRTRGTARRSAAFVAIALVALMVTGPAGAEVDVELNDVGHEVLPRLLDGGNYSQCNDRLDNDGDGRTDYPDDPGCSSASDGSESPDPVCGDRVDNDGDGRIDYPADPGCSSLSDGSESPDPMCDDRVDNDGDGRTDYPADPGCSSTSDGSESPDPACGDRVDNDGDGLTDYPSDPNCTDARDTSEFPAPACSDSVDNDGDGWSDYPLDPGCSSASDTSEGTTCDPISAAIVCLTPGPVRIEHPVMLISLPPGTSHRVQGYIDNYRFTLPGGVVVDVPCVTLGVDGTSSPCAEAGGTFVSRFFTIVDDFVHERTVVPGPTVATVRVCDATLKATVLGFGVQAAPAFALC